MINEQIIKLNGKESKMLPVTKRYYYYYYYGKTAS